MPDLFIAPLNKQEEPKQSDDLLMSKSSLPLTELPSNLHLFSSFVANPRGIHFQNQDSDEKVLLFIKRDLITNIVWVGISILFIFIPIIIAVASPFMGNFLNFLPGRHIFFYLLLYYLFVGTYVFVNFFTWYFNIALVTNKRIIDVDFSSLVYKNVAATKLSLVQDVSYDQVGIVRSIFDYGDILVQTAGTLDNFHFEAAPSPENAVHIIQDLIGKEARNGLS